MNWKTKNEFRFEISPVWDSTKDDSSSVLPELDQMFEINILGSRVDEYK